MAKQKIVVKVTMSETKKARKALKIAVSVYGVESAAFVGSDRDQIAVTGEGIDSVELTTLLRKRVGYTELVSVGTVEEKKQEATAGESKTPAAVEALQFIYPHHQPYPHYVYYDVPRDHDSCSIM